MSLSILGFLLFVFPHALSSLVPAVRDRAKAWVGEPKFKAVFALVSALGVILMTWAYWQSRAGGAGAEILYDPPGTKALTLVLVPVGVILVAASLGKSHLKLWLQNPMSLGISLWAIGHLLVSGKSAVVWFYAALLLVAVLDISSSLVRGKHPIYEPLWRDDIKAVLIGIVLIGIVAGLFHPYVLGVRL